MAFGRRRAPAARSGSPVRKKTAPGSGGQGAGEEDQSHRLAAENRSARKAEADIAGDGADRIAHGRRKLAHCAELRPLSVSERARQRAATHVEMLQKPTVVVSDIRNTMMVRFRLVASAEQVPQREAHQLCLSALGDSAEPVRLALLCFLPFAGRFSCPQRRFRNGPADPEASSRGRAETPIRNM